MSASKMLVTIEKGYLVVKVPMEAKPKPSSSGKTLVVASSHGNQKTEVEYEGMPIVVGLNAYVKHGGE